MRIGWKLIYSAGAVSKEGEIGMKIAFPHIFVSNLFLREILTYWTKIIEESFYDCKKPMFITSTNFGAD